MKLFLIREPLPREQKLYTSITYFNKKSNEIFIGRQSPFFDRLKEALFNQGKADDMRALTWATQPIRWFFSMPGVLVISAVGVVISSIFNFLLINYYSGVSAYFELGLLDVQFWLTVGEHDPLTAFYVGKFGAVWGTMFFYPMTWLVVLLAIRVWWNTERVSLRELGRGLGWIFLALHTVLIPFYIYIGYVFTLQYSGL